VQRNYAFAVPRCVAGGEKPIVSFVLLNLPLLVMPCGLASIQDENAELFHAHEEVAR
jgi:hypothetical protein